MHELWISVEKIEGVCSSERPMGFGTGFLVRNGRLAFPKGGPICLFALQSILPLIPAKERILDDDLAADWMAQVHLVQCPDPAGRTQWHIEQRAMGSTRLDSPALPEPAPGDLKIFVESIGGRCSEGMQVGHWALLRDSSLYLAQPFCIYALQAVLPMLPAMIRPLQPDDWMATENAFICPDPLGNVILRVEKI
ncbi:TIGR04076 family protein [Candidatus Bipolaricaulota bacterium]